MSVNLNHNRKPSLPLNLSSLENIFHFWNFCRNSKTLPPNSAPKFNPHWKSKCRTPEHRSASPVSAPVADVPSTPHRWRCHRPGSGAAGDRWPGRPRRPNCSAVTIAKAMWPSRYCHRPVTSDDGH